MSVDHTNGINQGIILLVDDNPTNLGVLFESLSSSGFKLLVAEDGESAIEQVNYVQPDIILLDVMMPGMDGFETCRRLKANDATRDIPVIFMTALTDTADTVTGLSIGAVDYITKPIQPDEVLARVKTHLVVHTLKRQLQAQNAQLQQEIQERQHAEQSLQLLLRAVSHDLRNPVTGMLMVLRNLIQTSPSGSHDADNSSDTLPSTIAVPRSILERMIESSDRQLKLINSLLEAHADDAQQPELQKQLVHLSELVSNITQDIQPIVEKSQASIKNLISSKLPPVCVDPDQLWRVFENLVINALKHNPPGLEIVIDADVQDGVLRCCVHDNGVGISPEQCDRLFEPYSRGKNAHHTHGLGLGLYLCRQIVYAHGGDIGIKSQLGEGSTFWFTLPLTSSESGHAESGHAGLFTQN